MKTQYHTKLHVNLKRNWRTLTSTLFKVSFIVLCTSCCSLLYGQQVYKFTNCGATGASGPSQAQVNSTYTATTLDGQVTCTNGFQYWTVPASGIYQFKLAGARGGGGNNYGRGAIIQANIMLIGGQKLKILVGQMGGYYSPSGSGSGGGGSFVATDLDVPIIVAGGGGGQETSGSGLGNANGQTTTKGGNAMCSGGTNGNGGNGCTSPAGVGGGGGFLTNGTNGTWGGGGVGFKNGATGGTSAWFADCIGGFGCGGGTHGNTGGGGGGGGYSGGAGGSQTQSISSGGGGGSYILATATDVKTSDGKYENSSSFGGNPITNLGTYNNGHGYVEITVISVGEADIEAIAVKPLTPKPNTMCVKTPYEFEVTFKNNGPDDASFINFEVSAPGMNTLTYNFFDIRDLGNGQTKSYLISTDKISCGVTGNQALTLTITKVLSDGDNINNNTSNTNYNVVSLPYGTNFTPAANFPGFPGNNTPDLVTHDKTYRYNFTAPTGYNNSGYGTTWSTSFSGVIDNEPLPADRYNIVAPMGGVDGYLTLNFKKEDIDKDVSIFFTIKESVNGICDSVITRQLHIAPMPDVTYEDVGGCLGSVLQFVNNSTIASGTIPKVFWDFGDGSTSTLFSPQKVFNTKGIYNVKLVVTSDLGFADSMIKTINVIETPVADFAFDNQCGLNPFQFTNNSTLASGTMTYVWNFGDENESTLKDPTHVYTQPGPYQVTLTATSDNGCHAEVTKPVYNYPNPNVDFTMPNTICQNSNVTLSNTTSILFSSWGSEWTVENDNMRIFEKSPSIVFQEHGQQWVKLKVTTQFGCTDSIVKLANVIPGPGINITYSDVCSNTPVTFHSGIDAPQNIKVDYIWNVGGMLSAKSDPTFSIGKAGKYNVSLNITYDNACSASKSMVVETGYRPHADFSLPDVTCAGEPISISNNTTVAYNKALYYWNMGDGATYSNVVTPNHIYNNAAPTQYTITLVATSENGICPDTVAHDVTIGVVPSCNFNITHDWTFGQRGYTFTPEHQGAEYKWYFGDGLLSNEQSPIHKYNRDGKFPVKLIVTSPEGCQCEKVIDNVVQNLDVNTTFAQFGFGLYPNPSNGIVTITNNNNVTVSNISVTNIVGETVLNSSQHNADSQYTLNLSDLTNGVYLIRVTTLENQVLTHKVIITK
ncbi:MAG: PKD domain-containing protein [Bacteroidia bacterium]|nr:PKD domain-containing protein [Bacteroidia bacterium]